MPSYSISANPAPEPKTSYDEGTLAPTTGQAIELRVDPLFFRDRRGFWDVVAKMVQRMRERGQPRL